MDVVPAGPRRSLRSLPEFPALGGRKRRGGVFWRIEALTELKAPGGLELLFVGFYEVWTLWRSLGIFAQVVDATADRLPKASQTVPSPKPVPELLRGAWRRTSIHNADGSSDTTSTVVWLQLESMMVDVRFSLEQAELADRGSLNNCSLRDLRLLATSESSSGYTTCTPVKGEGADRRATAEWFTRGHGVAFQPVTAYPEPGLLEWDASGDVMIERAPSGAYVEEWHRVENTDAPLQHTKLDDGRQLYRTGSFAVLVRERPHPVPRQARLSELIDEAGDDHAAVAAMVDCEFSLAELRGDSFVITASTLPWKEGELLNVDL